MEYYGGYNNIPVNMNTQYTAASQYQAYQNAIPQQMDGRGIKRVAEEKPKEAKKKRETGFTKTFKLSPELAAIMGKDRMPRHEVVKQMWAIIKERNLYDPKNKQYAICDEELMKVFGVQRFRTFGMMKHLKDHFLEDK